jgi:predicted ArsR family transcriptional regulator
MFRIIVSDRKTNGTDSVVLSTEQRALSTRKVAVTEKTDQIRKLVKERLAELDKERKALEEALKQLGGDVQRKVRRGRPAGSTSTGRKRRSRKGGTRADHALKAVSDSPGITAGEIAKKLDIKPNYVYRVMGDLVEDKQVKKKGRGYYPA